VTSPVDVAGVRAERRQRGLLAQGAAGVSQVVLRGGGPYGGWWQGWQRHGLVRCTSKGGGVAARWCVCAMQERLILTRRTLNLLVCIYGMISVLSANCLPCSSPPHLPSTSNQSCQAACQCMYGFNQQFRRERPGQTASGAVSAATAGIFDQTRVQKRQLSPRSKLLSNARVCQLVASLVLFAATRPWAPDKGM
jgi:hypothetical protein